MTALERARSVKRGSLDAATIAGLGNHGRIDVANRSIAEVAAGVRRSNGDVFLHEGDLHVAGDFDAAAEGVVLLVVRGSLLVDGAYTDRDDPQTIVLVEGDLRARDVVTEIGRAHV
jgi:hypothetical protein